MSVRNLTKAFPNGVVALNNVSFEIKKGEFLVVIGLSGSGKTTLLRCLNRLLEPTSGNVFFDGECMDNVKNPRQLRRRVGMIFQHFNLIPRHSVMSNVLMGGLGKVGTIRSLLQYYSDAEKVRALQYLEMVGLAPQADWRADQLSGGQQQRVAIARALYQQPELLLADEPVASLDPATAHTVMDHLRRANQELGITIICNLHFLSLVREYATRVIALRAGEVVFTGSPQEIDAHWFKRIYGEEARDIHVR
jgi:phosphonate transport system ATP-binding protein